MVCLLHNPSRVFFTAPMANCINKFMQFHNNLNPACLVFHLRASRYHRTPRRNNNFNRCNSNLNNFNNNNRNYSLNNQIPPRHNLSNQRPPQVPPPHLLKRLLFL